MNIEPFFSLLTIYLRESNVKLNDDISPLQLSKQKLLGRFRIAAQDIVEVQAEDKSDLNCIYQLNTTFEFIYVADVDALAEIQSLSSPLLVINAKFTAEYHSAKPVTPNDLQQWAATNCLLHTWPYWREYCQSLQSRMGFPSSPMPLCQLVNQSNNDPLEDEKK